MQCWGQKPGLVYAKHVPQHLCHLPGLHLGLSGTQCYMVHCDFNFLFNFFGKEERTWQFSPLQRPYVVRQWVSERLSHPNTRDLPGLQPEWLRAPGQLCSVNRTNPQEKQSMSDGHVSWWLMGDLCVWFYAFSRFLHRALCFLGWKEIDTLKNREQPYS